MEFYNNKIQLDISVIDDIVSLSPKCMLVFGMGYDSMLWHHLTNGNTFFVEDDPKYISLNSEIPPDRVILYSYNTNLETTQSDELMPFPQLPYDVILIDGPAGYNASKPGRFLPIYWSTFIDTAIIYVDDRRRKTEKNLIKRFFKSREKREFAPRDGTVKIFPRNLSDHS